MADVVVAAGVDAARDLHLQLAHPLGAILVGELLGDVLGDGDGARIGERAVVQPRAGDDVADQVHVRGGEPGLGQRGPDRRNVVQLHVRQDQVLLVGDADVVLAEALGEVGHDLHLLGGGVPGGFADALQRHLDDRVARDLVWLQVVAREPGEGRGRGLGRLEGLGHRRQGFERLRDEGAADAGELGVR